MAITVRLTEEEQAQLDNLKRFLSMKSSTKALLHAAGEHRKLKDELEREKQKSQRLEWALDALQRSVKDYDHARHYMMELANKKSA